MHVGFDVRFKDGLFVGVSFGVAVDGETVAVVGFLVGVDVDGVGWHVVGNTVGDVLVVLILYLYHTITDINDGNNAA